MQYNIELTTSGGLWRAEVTDSNDRGVYIKGRDREAVIAQAIVGFDALASRVGEAQQPQHPVASRHVAVDSINIRHLLEEAIALKRVVRIDYTDADGNYTSRMIAPSSFSGGRPGRFSTASEAVVAIDTEKDQVRHFRIDRIDRLESTD